MIWLILETRAEFKKWFCSFFGSNEKRQICFWNLLTFTEHKLMTHALYKTPNPKNFSNRHRCQIFFGIGILKVEFPKSRQNKSKLVWFQYYSCPNQFKPVCRDFRASFWSPSSDSLKTLNDVWFSEILLLAVYCILLPFCFLTHFFFSFFPWFFST